MPVLQVIVFPDVHHFIDATNVGAPFKLGSTLILLRHDNAHTVPDQLRRCRAQCDLLVGDFNEISEIFWLAFVYPQLVDLLHGEQNAWRSHGSVFDTCMINIVNQRENHSTRDAGTVWSLFGNPI